MESTPEQQFDIWFSQTHSTGAVEFESVLDEDEFPIEDSYTDAPED